MTLHISVQYILYDTMVVNIYYSGLKNHCRVQLLCIIACDVVFNSVGIMLSDCRVD